MSTVGARRVAARVDGVVQGVGFRPYVFRLAGELGVAGFVGNDARGVVVEAEGPPEAVERFLAELPARAPPLARVERVEVRDVPALGARTFEIARSSAVGAADALVSPDTATCDACLRELLDPADRRYRYPFVNCTDCGPRFTIVRGVPYDRPLTTMAGFAMCPACAAEYEDPSDRRFHAQPNACPECGPHALLVGAASDAAGAASDTAGAASDAVRGAAGALASPGAVPAPDAVACAAALLRDGAILAVKGLGGYHLACRADDERAVAALRARKRREDKPFALMAPDPDTARALVALGPGEEALLTSRARPIVLASRRPGARVAAAVAPASRELGVMLPYSPLHHLLLHDAACTLVMTSGNVSDEPIAYRDDDALARLAPIADAFLVHDRPIHVRTDDSVVRVVRGRPLWLRRSRGLVPDSMALPVPCARPVLACGADLKSTFCVAKGGRAWVGHHIGDLEDAGTFASYAEGADHFERLFAVRPAVVAHDLHPDYRSTVYGLGREDVETVAVQHHHAHLAAVLAEHGETSVAVGAIYDGTGLGPDGTVWGGEILAGDLRGFERAGHLHPVRLPGGDRAAREPWRMTCAWLAAVYEGEPPLPDALAKAVDGERWRAVARMALTGFAAPVTTSMGRLFDAAAALCGVRTESTYEGQAAIELEAVADPAASGAYPLPVCGPSDHAPARAAAAHAPSDHATAPAILDARATIAALLADLATGTPVPAASMRFHRAVARATVTACAAAARRAGTRTTVLSGGVFQNRLLLEAVTDGLEARGLRVLVPERLPPNDGGISFGQAAVAGARA